MVHQDNLMRYYMLNKPRGCVTARSDAVHRTVMDFFPPELAADLHPVGRLDKDTEGLLIITDDGQLDMRIMQPGKHISKTYFFYALGEMTSEKQQRLESGIAMADFTTGSASLSDIHIYRIGDLEEFMPEYRRERYMRNPDGPAFSASLTMYEGRKHEVKRMLEAVFCRIFYLRRDMIGSLALDRSLSPGEFRELSADELELLMKSR